MNEITSVNNPNIKEVIKLHQKKYRESSKFFLVEGQKTYEEINNQHIKIEQIFVLKDDVKKFNVPENKATIVNDAVMKRLCTTDSSANIVTLAIKPLINISQFKKYNTIALLENIKDAGNLGTIIRSAASFSIDAILLYGDTVDLYNQKVIRSSAGNYFKVPIVKLTDLKELQNEFIEFQFISTGLNEKKQNSAKDINFKKKSLIMFGSEADGLSEELLSLANSNLVIDMSAGVESLNLAVAASIVFYEIFRKLKD